MKWILASEKPFPDKRNWEMLHMRYAFDKTPVPHDLFELTDEGLRKIGGTGLLPFNEIEWLDETESTPVSNVSEEEIEKMAREKYPGKEKKAGSHGVIIRECRKSFIAGYKAAQSNNVERSVATEEPQR